MQDQTKIIELCQIDPIQRDETWEKEFLSLLPHSKVRLVSETPNLGYDSWPYLYAQLEESSQEPLSNILNWLSEKGIGLIINGENKEPDYVFNYGSIWNFREKGQFITPLETNVATGRLELENKTALKAGPPSSNYLPTYVRKILKQFLFDQGILVPKVLVMSDDEKHYDLCISLESLESPPQKEHAGIAEAIQWFLPQHYSIVLISERGLPSFVNL